ncbi:ATP-binding protein [Nocardioides sp. B-3]|uniref:ATP-binding protein n=1 Tax=Nocardioides sp. B-3 TaxID=2895565 RepID=UPI002152FF64|nr:ATP-binding protein [Nocardioides sp. B-3]UUZ61009.1 ATP-binding protein [Nocardioides sp. B-3]
MPPAPVSARPSSPAATSSWPPSTSCSSGWSKAAPGTLPRAHRAARCRQDGAAQRAALCRRARRRWGTGKLEARPDRGLRRPLSSALHRAVRELGHTDADSVDHVLGVIKAFAHRDAGAGAKLKDQWNPGIDAPAVRGRADSGDIEIDPVELFTDLGGLAADVGKGIAVFIDEMQDLGPDDVSALCAACHEISQTGLPVIVVGAGLPHLPAVLSASKSYSERLFSYQRIDRLARDAADRALTAPAEDEDAAFTSDALAAMYAATGGYPYFIRAYGKAVWDRAPRSPITVDDVLVATPEAESELAVGFFGSRYERATPGEREYLRAMADVAAASEEPDVDAVPTADVAAFLDKKPQSLSPARRRC